MAFGLDPGLEIVAGSCGDARLTLASGEEPALMQVGTRCVVDARQQRQASTFTHIIQPGNCKLTENAYTHGAGTTLASQLCLAEQGLE